MRWNLRQIAFLFCITCFTTFTTNVYAVAAGFYVGGQVGYARTNQPNLPLTGIMGDVNSFTNNTKTSTLLLRSAIAPSLQLLATPAAFSAPLIGGFKNSNQPNTVIGRAFIGYQFLPWIGAEIGYAGFGSTKVSYKALTFPGVATLNAVRVNGIPAFAVYNTNYSSIARNDDITRKVVDLYIRLSIPVYEVFDAYFKIGGAYVRSTTNTTVNIDNFVNGAFNPPIVGLPANANGSYFSTNPVKLKATVQSSQFTPAYSFGMTYYYEGNIGIDLSYTQYGSSFKTLTGRNKIKRNNNNQLSGINYIALGFSYHIVDRYCGQFLCD